MRSVDLQQVLEIKLLLKIVSKKRLLKEEMKPVIYKSPLTRMNLIMESREQVVNMIWSYLDAK